MKKLQKLINSPYKNIIFSLASIIVLFLTYQFYVWTQTESTDNAYLEADITFISPEVTGVVEEILIHDNKKVAKGELIAKINNLNYKTAYEEAANDYEAAKKGIEIISQKIELTSIEVEKAEDAQNLAKFNLTIAEKELARNNQLTKESFSSKKVQDDTKSNYQKTFNDFNQANLNLLTKKLDMQLLQNQKIADEFKLTSMNERLIKAQRDLEKCNITSPIDGIISNSAIRLGSLVRPGFLIAAIVPSDSFYVKANFKETQIRYLNPGMKAEVKLDTFSGIAITGRVKTIQPATGSKFSLLPTDNATGNYTRVVQKIPVILEVVIPEKIKQNVAAGMSATVKIRTD